MTDREELIQDAARAIWEESTVVGQANHWEDESPYVMDEHESMARAAFEVFEKAQGVAEDQQEQLDPALIHLAARKGGKTQGLIDAMLDRANDRGLRVEVVYPEDEPTDVQTDAAMAAWCVRDTLTGVVYPQPNKLIAEKVAQMHGHCEVSKKGECPQPCAHLSQEDAREGRTCAEHPCACTEPQGERERFTDHSERYVPKRPKAVPQGEPTNATWPRRNDYFDPPLTNGQMEQVQQCINDALSAPSEPTDVVVQKEFEYRIRAAVAYGRDYEKWREISVAQREAWIAEQAVLAGSALRAAGEVER